MANAPARGPLADGASLAAASEGRGLSETSGEKPAGGRHDIRTSRVSEEAAHERGREKRIPENRGTNKRESESE